MRRRKEAGPPTRGRRPPGTPSGRAAVVDETAAWVVGEALRAESEPADKHRALLVDERTGTLAPALAAAGWGVWTWNREHTALGPGDPWPTPPPDAAGTSTSCAVVRLHKDRRAAAMALHAAAAQITAGGALWLYGANDEGARSAGRLLAEVAEGVETVDTRRHCRVWRGRRGVSGAGADPVRGALEDWAVRGRLELPGGRALPWVSWPGTFAGGALDAGSASLITALAGHPLPPGAGPILDYGAGPGALTAALIAAGYDGAVDLIEPDALALSAAAINVPSARRLSGLRLSAAGDTRYARIMSNPPIHQGRHEDHRALRALIHDAPAHLLPGGDLWLVVQRRVDLTEPLCADYGRVEVVREDARFRVWRAWP